MSQTSLDIRQSQTRVLQDQIDSAAVTQMDSVLASINNELTPPGRLIAAATPSLVVTVGTGTVVNPNTSKNRILPFVNNTPVAFTGGTITFPSGTGTVTVSPGTNISITIGASQFLAITVQLDSTGNLNLSAGTATSSLATALAAASPGSSSFLSLGVIVIQSNGSSVIQNITNAMLYQFGSGTGGSSGTGGTGDDLDALQYQTDFADPFTSAPGNTLSSITTSNTNASYSAAKNSFTISYDASKTVTGTGTSMTLSGTPSFTVQVGDILRVGTQARKITVVTTQTSYTIESAFTTNPSAAAATVSQAVYTVDLNNAAADGVAISAIYTSTISDTLVTYNDTSSGTLYNYTDPALVAYIASADGTNYSSVASREANLSSTMSVTSLPTTGSNLYLRFFSNASSGTGTALLFGYKAFFHRVSQTESGGILNQAYCFTNSVGTPVNCSNPTVNGSGVTQIVTTFSFPVGVNSGSPNGGIVVYLNGQKIPRFINSTLTPDASYTELNATTIQLDRNYSSQNLSVEIFQFVAVVDSNTSNTTNISAIQTSQLRNALINGNFDFWQRGTSVTVANTVSTYQADRWYVKNSLGTNGVITYSQASPVLTNSKFGAKVQITTAPTAAQANGTEIYQTLENEDSLVFLNNSACFSVQIKALGNVTSVGLQFFYATTETKVTTALGSEQSVIVNSSTFTLGQLTGQSIGTTPTTSGVVGVRVRILGVSSGNTYDLNNGFVLEQAIVNLGGTPINFQRAGANTAQELSLCQRYYEKTYDVGTAPGTATGAGSGPLNAQGMVNGVAITWSYIYKVTKRVTPTVTAYSPFSGASGKCSVGATDVTVSVGAFNTEGLFYNQSTSVSAGNGYVLHVTADADI